jgi:ribosomal protein L11 methyltransferase
MYQPFTVGSRFRILPPGTPPCDGRLDLVLERGAFGGGTHPTTAGCLEILEQLPEVANARVLDLGSGSGILAIAALRLGASGALCVDVSPAAVASARRNGRLNGCGRRLRHLTGTLAEVAAAGFDLALANIGGELLHDLAPALVDKVRPGGRLLLSGALAEDGAGLRRLYAGLGCELQAERRGGPFLTLLLRRATP